MRDSSSSTVNFCVYLRPGVKKAAKITSEGDMTPKLKFAEGTVEVSIFFGRMEFTDHGFLWCYRRKSALLPWTAHLRGESPPEYGDER